MKKYLLVVSVLCTAIMLQAPTASAQYLFNNARVDIASHNDYDGKLTQGWGVGGVNYPSEIGVSYLGCETPTNRCVYVPTSQGVPTTNTTVHYYIPSASFYDENTGKMYVVGQLRTQWVPTNGGGYPLSSIQGFLMYVDADGKLDTNVSSTNWLPGIALLDEPATSVVLNGDDEVVVLVPPLDIVRHKVGGSAYPAVTMEWLSGSAYQELDLVELVVSEDRTEITVCGKLDEISGPRHDVGLYFLDERLDYRSDGNNGRTRFSVGSNSFVLAGCLNDSKDRVVAGISRIVDGTIPYQALLVRTEPINCASETGCLDTDFAGGVVRVGLASSETTITGMSVLNWKTGKDFYAVGMIDSHSPYWHSASELFSSEDGSRFTGWGPNGRNVHIDSAIDNAGIATIRSFASEPGLKAVYLTGSWYLDSVGNSTAQTHPQRGLVKIGLKDLHFGAGYESGHDLLDLDSGNGSVVYPYQYNCDFIYSPVAYHVQSFKPTPGAPTVRTYTNDVYYDSNTRSVLTVSSGSEKGNYVNCPAP